MANLTNQNQDIDLTIMSRKVKGYFSRMSDSFYEAILFVKRNFIILLALIIIGVGLGIYKDNVDRMYEQKLFVIPNFGSTDFLYEEILNLNYKIKRRDAEFMEKSGIKNPEKFVKVEIEPVIEIYQFIEDKDVDEDDRKFQLFKLISENGDMEKVLKNNITSRNYKKHLITITTNDKAEKGEIVDPLLNYLNSRPYFLEMKKEYSKNLDLKIAANDTVVSQIDRLLNSFADRRVNSNTVYYNDNTELDKVINLRNRITVEQAQNRIDRANYTHIVKESGELLNMPHTGFTVGIMKYITPLLLVLAFVLSVRFSNFYKRQKAKRAIVQTV